MRLRLFTLFAVAGLIMSACGGSTSPAPSTASQAPASQPAASAGASGPAPSASSAIPDITATAYKAEPVGHKGGNLVIGISGDPTTVWQNIYDTFANDCEAFCPSLWGLWNNTNDLKYYPQLTTEVPTEANGGIVVTGDKMDVTVKMIDGAQWSDGHAMNCDDVIGMWKWQLDKGQAGNVQGTTGYEDIASIDGAGTSTCVLHFSKIYESYLGLFTPLLPKHYLDTSSVADAAKNLYVDTKLKDAVWSGPYIPTAWAHDAQIDYIPNAKFWSTIKKADAPFDTVKMKFYADTDAEIAGFANDEIDVGLEFNQNQVPAMSAIDPASVDKIPGPTYEQHSWNLASLKTKFGDAGAKALMEALHYAYDKDAIITTITGGTVTATCNQVYPGAWFYANIPCYPHDAAKAESILTAGGFTKDADGNLTINGKKVEIAACARADRQYRVDTLNLVASQLKPLGISMTVKTVPPATLFAGWVETPADTPCNFTHGNYDVGEFAWVGTPDPGSLYNLYHSSKDPSVGDHSGQNYIRVNTKEIDDALTTVKTSVDLLKIGEAMKTFQEEYVDPANAFPEIAIYNWTTVMLKSPKMHNIANNGSSSVQTWNIEDWWKAE